MGFACRIADGVVIAIAIVMGNGVVTHILRALMFFLFPGEGECMMVWYIVLLAALIDKLVNYLVGGLSSRLTGAIADIFFEIEYSKNNARNTYSSAIYISHPNDSFIIHSCSYSPYSFKGLYSNSPHTPHSASIQTKIHLLKNLIKNHNKAK